MRHRFRQSMSIVAMLVLLGGALFVSPVVASQTPTVGSSPDVSNATFEAGTCLWDLPRTLDDGQSMTCGFVKVPLFHADPDGASIRLAVGIIKPERGEPAGEPLLMLNGGPGGNSNTLVQLFAPSFIASYAALRKGREIVVFDQRGTGFSAPGLYCPGDIDPATDRPVRPDDGAAAGEPKDETAYEAAGAACAAGLERITDLTAFTTTESAQDVNDIRVALGYRQIDLWGQSYGTRLALEAMRLYPEGVITSTVLESVLPPDRPFLSTFVVGFNDALVRLADACAADRACSAAYPDVLGDFERAVDRFNDRPLQTSFVDLVTDRTTPVSVDGATISFLVYQLVFSGILVGVVPDFLHALADGDSGVLDQYLPVLSVESVATGFYYSVLCQDELAFESLSETQSAIADEDLLPVIANDRVGLGIADYFAVCRGFGLPPSDPVQAEPVSSDIPTLIVSGEYDPITPPSNGEDAAQSLSNSQVVVASALAHTPIAFSQRCLLARTIDFLNDADATIDFSCAADPRVDFLTP